jgi:hypothetical protein
MMYFIPAAEAAVTRLEWTEGGVVTERVIMRMSWLRRAWTRLEMSS